MQTLKEVIEHIDDNEARKTFELVSWFQVQHVRLTNRERRDHGVEFDDLLYDTTLLQEYINRLFDYARNEEQSTAIRKAPRREMTDALKNVVGMEAWMTQQNRLLGVLAIINRRHP